MFRNFCLRFLCVVLFLNLQIFANPTKSTKEAKVTLVTSAPIQVGNSKQTHAYVGSLYFSQKSALASEVSGIVETIYVSEGQRVKKGESLLSLNSDLLKNEIAAKEGLLKQAKAQFAKVKKDYARYKSLYESESISFKEYEDMLFDVEAQKGNMESIANDLAFLKTQQKKKTILAPYDGVVLQKLLNEGEWVSAGASVFNIAKLSPLEATFEVSFEILQSLNLNDKLQVQIDGKNYAAKVSALIPLGDSKSRTFPVKLDIEDSNAELIEGLEVRATFDIKGDANLFVPRDCILPTPNGNTIFIIKDNIAKQVFVEVQTYEGFNAFIKPLNYALSADNRVIVIGFERLKDGDLVKESEK